MTHGVEKDNVYLYFPMGKLDAYSLGWAHLVARELLAALTKTLFWSYEKATRNCPSGVNFLR